MVARAAMLGDTGANHPDHWVGGLASPDLHAIADPVRPRRCGAASVASTSTTSTASRIARAWTSLSSLDLEATPPFDHAHDHFGYRDRLSQPAIEGTGDEPDAGLRRAAQAGRVHPRLPGRRRPPRPICRSRRSFRAMAASWPIAGWKSTWARFAISCAQHGQDARGAGAHRGEADGALAQRRTARAGAGKGRSRAWAPIRSGTTTSITRRWTRSAMRCRWARTCGG